MEELLRRHIQYVKYMLQGDKHPYSFGTETLSDSVVSTISGHKTMSRIESRWNRKNAKHIIFYHDGTQSAA